MNRTVCPVKKGGNADSSKDYSSQLLRATPIKSGPCSATDSYTTELSKQKRNNPCDCPVSITAKVVDTAHEDPQVCLRTNSAMAKSISPAPSASPETSPSSKNNYHASSSRKGEVATSPFPVSFPSLLTVFGVCGASQQSPHRRRQAV